MAANGTHILGIAHLKQSSTGLMFVRSIHVSTPAFPLVIHAAARLTASLPNGCCDKISSFCAVERLGSTKHWEHLSFNAYVNKSVVTFASRCGKNGLADLGNDIARGGIGRRFPVSPVYSIGKPHRSHHINITAVRKSLGRRCLIRHVKAGSGTAQDASSSSSRSPRVRLAFLRDSGAIGV
jgi:hypothetical protein